jgi:hypothetical protein
MTKNNFKKNNQNINWFHTIITLILGLIIGLIPTVYQWRANLPKLDGRIITVATGEFENKTVHTVFAFISNKRNIPVPIVDYSLDLIYDRKIQRDLRPKYLKTKNLTLTFDKEKFQMNIPVGDSYLLNKVNNLITPQNPMSGFVVFEGENYRDSTLKKAILTLEDGFGGKHKIETDATNFRSPELLKFIINNLTFSEIEKNK